MNSIEALGPYRDRVLARLAALEGERFGARLEAHDATLWGDQAERRAVAANRLGWLALPAAMPGESAALEAFAVDVAAEGFTHAVLLGMGGSSLAPEVLRATLGVRPGSLELTVLDNTSPAAVRAVLESHDLARTLFVVSSKSGGTLEVTSFEAFFFDRVAAARGARAGRGFVAITDPGTSLEALAARRGYRRVFLNPADIGGRYSALSLFGLVPAALIGADLGALLGAARDAGTEAGVAAAVRLGAALGELALAGRDKVTLVLGEPFAALGGWIEQLIAESTGKEGRGLVPVAEEPLGDVRAYGEDRVFVATTVGDPAPLAARLEPLRAAGHPVLAWSEPASAGLGAEFLRWEIATATAGAVIGVNPFDEPNVTEAKQATRAVLDRFLAEGRVPAPQPLARRGEVEAEASPAAAGIPAGGGDPFEVAAGLAALARPGDYLAILAYLRRTDARHARLQALRVRLRDASRLATTLGYGPRFLHSTGQLHKGGPNRGLFLQITADEGPELPIPGERFGFGALRRAQAAGDFEVLARRGRRVVHLHLGSAIDEGLDALLGAAAAHRA